MAWSRETLVRLEGERKPVDPRFADLLSKVARGEMSKDEAWRTWLEMRDQEEASR